MNPKSAWTTVLNLMQKSFSLNATKRKMDNFAFLRYVTFPENYVSRTNETAARFIRVVWITTFIFRKPSRQHPLKR